MFGTGLGGLLCGLGFPLGVMISYDESCGGNGGSLTFPFVNICGAGTGGGVCTKCTDNNSISSISYKSTKS